MGIQPNQMDLKDKQITVMGLGHFGGNLAAIRFLYRAGARLTVTDLKSESELNESLDTIADCELEALHMGGHQESDFLEKDLIVVSPAVPPTNSFIQLAIENGIPVTTELNLFWERIPAPVIAVTGSNGKSTTTGMIHSILSEAGFRSHLGGNIGHSLLNELDQIKEDDVVVLELSSFQLEYLSPLKPAPYISVVTNFSPNHLDWHGRIEQYEQAKKNITRFQRDDQFLVIPEDDTELANWNTKAQVVPVNRNPNLKTDLQIPGEHHLDNASLASAVAKIMGVTPEKISEGLKAFRGFPHRLEKVDSESDRMFYNDSLATTPESAVAAIRAFDRPVYLIAGGYDKKTDLSAFASEISKSVTGVALLGQTSDSLYQAIQKNGNSGKLTHIEKCDSLEFAFRTLYEWSTPGSVILLSPGCASYDQFANFQQRGECFKELVKNLTDS